MAGDVLTYIKQAIRALRFAGPADPLRRRRVYALRRLALPLRLRAGLDSLRHELGELPGHRRNVRANTLDSE
jgi:hypothetical protein